MKKINVLYLSTTGQGGATFSLFNMINSIKEHIHPIVVFPDKNGVYQMFVDNGIECIVVPFQEEIFYAGQFRNFPTIQKCRFLGGRLRNIIKWNLFFNRCVKKKLGIRKIHIVHTNNGSVDLGPSLAKALNAKHIWHLREFQDLDFDAHPFFGWKRFYSKLYRSDAIIAITKAIAEHFHILNGQHNGMFLWNAVAKKNDAVYINNKENYICFVASLISPGKGLHDLLKAYAKSELPNAGITIRIAGEIKDSNYKKEIADLITKSGIEPHIEWLGFCKEPKKLISNAKALVMPSAYEALGRVAIEAMFYGCPTIAHNSGGPKEFIENRETGYLFNDTEELINILNHVYRNDQNNLIRKSMDFAVRNFSEETYANKILTIYKHVLGYQ